jgi:hypothetical protein
VTDEARAAAQRLFNKLTREDKGAVLTVGIGKAATGKPILIAYCAKDAEVAVPEIFEDYVVLKSVGHVRTKERARA